MSENNTKIYQNKTRNALPDTPDETSAKAQMDLLEKQVGWHRKNSGQFVAPKMQKGQDGEGLLPSDD